MTERWKGGVKLRRGRRDDGGDLTSAPVKRRVYFPKQDPRDRVTTLAELNAILWGSRPVGSMR